MDTDKFIKYEPCTYIDMDKIPKIEVQDLLYPYIKSGCYVDKVLIIDASCFIINSTFYSTQKFNAEERILFIVDNSNKIFESIIKKSIVITSVGNIYFQYTQCSSEMYCRIIEFETIQVVYNGIQYSPPSPNINFKIVPLPAGPLIDPVDVPESFINVITLMFRLLATRRGHDIIKPVNLKFKELCRQYNDRIRGYEDKIRVLEEIVENFSKEIKELKERNYRLENDIILNEEVVALKNKNKLLEDTLTEKDSIIFELNKRIKEQSITITTLVNEFSDNKFVLVTD